MNFLYFCNNKTYLDDPEKKHYKVPFINNLDGDILLIKYNSFSNKLDDGNYSSMEFPLFYYRSNDIKFFNLVKICFNNYSFINRGASNLPRTEFEKQLIKEIIECSKNKNYNKKKELKKKLKLARIQKKKQFIENYIKNDMFFSSLMSKFDKLYEINLVDLIFANIKNHNSYIFNFNAPIIDIFS